MWQVWWKNNHSTVRQESTRQFSWLQRISYRVIEERWAYCPQHCSEGKQPTMQAQNLLVEVQFSGPAASTTTTTTTTATAAASTSPESNTFIKLIFNKFHRPDESANILQGVVVTNTTVRNGCFTTQNILKQCSKEKFSNKRIYLKITEIKYDISILLLISLVL